MQNLTETKQKYLVGFDRFIDIEWCEFALDLGRRLGWRLIVRPLNDEGKKWDTNDTSIIYKSTFVILVLEVSNHYE